MLIALTALLVSLFGPRFSIPPRIRRSLPALPALLLVGWCNPAFGAQALGSATPIEDAGAESVVLLRSRTSTVDIMQIDVLAPETPFMQPRRTRLIARQAQCSDSW